MTQEEKIAHISTLLLVSGNTTKMVRFFVLQALPNLPEEKLDQIISVLESE